MQKEQNTNNKSAIAKIANYYKSIPCKYPQEFLC